MAKEIFFSDLLGRTFGDIRRPEAVAASSLGSFEILMMTVWRRVGGTTYIVMQIIVVSGGRGLKTGKF